MKKTKEDGMRGRMRDVSAHARGGKGAPLYLLCPVCVCVCVCLSRSIY